VAKPGLTIQAGEQIADDKGRALFGFVAKWNRAIQPPKYTVSELPPTARVGDQTYATDLCVFNGAGTQETTGNGTGGLVTYNGTNWVIAGTNVTASA